MCTHTTIASIRQMFRHHQSRRRKTSIMWRGNAPTSSPLIRCLPRQLLSLRLMNQRNYQALLLVTSRSSIMAGENIAKTVVFEGRTLCLHLENATGSRLLTIVWCMIIIIVEEFCSVLIPGTALPDNLYCFTMTSIYLACYTFWLIHHGDKHHVLCNSTYPMGG